MFAISRTLWDYPTSNYVIFDIYFYPTAVLVSKEQYAGNVPVNLYKANCINFSFLNPLWCNGPISIWCWQTSFMTYFLLFSNRASLTWKILFERHWLHTELNKNNKKLYILGWLVDMAICIHSKAFWRINEDPILESLKQPHPLLYLCYFDICCYVSACVLAIPSEAYQCRYTYAHMYIYADNNRF